MDLKGYVHAFNVRYFKLPTSKQEDSGHSELFHCVSKDMVREDISARHAV